MVSWELGAGLISLVSVTLFSTLNVALRLPSRGRIADQFERWGRQAAFERFVATRHRFMLTTALLRSTGVLVLFATALFISLDGEREIIPLRIAVACVTSWAMVLIFAIAIPNAWAKYSGEWLIVRCLPLLSLADFLCRPAVVVAELFDPLVRRLAGAPVRDAKSFADELEQEILSFVSEGEIHGAVDEEEKEMIESVFELGDMRAEEIMTPRTEVIAIPVDTGLDQVLETIRTKGPSRIPVYEGNIDTILGVLYAKDLLGRDADAPFDIREIMRKPLFIPESKPVPELLRELQARRVHMAIVLDEYGGTAGLVTLEDILEELVGELADEYETETTVGVKKIDEFTYEVDARMRIDDLSDELNIDLPDDKDYETIGGFVFSTLGKIPQAGESCTHDNIAIQVIAAEPRRITRVRVKITPPAQPNGLEP